MIFLWLFNSYRVAQQSCLLVIEDYFARALLALGGGVMPRDRQVFCQLQINRFRLDEKTLQARLRKQCANDL
jgi:hypothetical protein